MKNPARELKSLLNNPVAAAMYYDISSRRFAQVDEDGGQDLTWEEAAKWLGAQGIRTTKGMKDTASTADKILVAIRKYRTIHYCGPLAGYTPGYHALDGIRFVVTEGATFIKPKKCGWRRLRRFLTLALRDKSLPASQGGPDIQLEVFHTWVRDILMLLRTGRWRRTKVLALSGPVESGKSFLQRLVITPILGGRSANPYSWMSGTTQFNAELLAAGHLSVDDNEPRIDAASRRNLAAKIKEVTSNANRRFEAKFRMPHNLIALSGVTFSMNEEPENLMVLPPQTSDIQDKMILLRFNAVASQVFRNLPEAVALELPGYVWWLERYRPPAKALENGSVRAFKHPVLVEKLHETSVESAFEATLVSYLKTTGWPTLVRKSAMEVQAALENWEATPQTLKQKIFMASNSCGTHLSRLQGLKNSELIIYRSALHGRTIWSLGLRNKTTLRQLVRTHIEAGRNRATTQNYGAFT